MSEEIYKDLIVLADKIDFIEGRQEKLEVAVESALKDVGVSAEFLSNLRQDVDEAPKKLSDETQKHVALIQSEGDSIKIQLARLELSTRANAIKAEGAAAQAQEFLAQNVERFNLERERNDPERIRAELAATKERFTLIDESIAKVSTELATRVDLNPCGCYDPNRAYKRGDLVELNGSSFISLENANREKPSKKSKRWMLSAGRGGSVVLGANSTQGGGLTIIAQDSDSVTVEV